MTNVNVIPKKSNYVKINNSNSNCDILTVEISLISKFVFFFVVNDLKKKYFILEQVVDLLILKM